MEFTGPYCYTLHFFGDETNRSVFKKVYEGNVSNFKAPVTQKNVPKIYIVKYQKQIVYVGYASQSIGARIGQGIRANGKKGYHGYKWKQAPEVELLVFVFDKELQGKKHADDKPFVEFAEAVEAELVYLVRQNTGQWPKYQNEIHFNNEQLNEVKRIALEIYAKIPQ